ncbi:hypothetical protein l11_18810 [Neisseria weaveri LMG 5135]|nr:hypothetical protein l11_18810 [Neisseria weaveri LMG 5135]EGV37351.1 hypothetical protein l13_03830 [Neisseria weaveri ATCC 51223]
MQALFRHASIFQTASPETAYGSDKYVRLNNSMLMIFSQV